MCNCSMKLLGISNESSMSVLLVYNISDRIKLTNLQLRLQDSEKMLIFNNILKHSFLLILLSQIFGKSYE